MDKEFFKGLNQSLKKRLSGLPSFPQWSSLFKVLTNKEKTLFFFFLICFLGSATFLLFSLYARGGEAKPAKGGSYTEGIIGQPRFINPVLASSDADRDLVEILFSGLMKYNQRGEIIPDLIREYKIKEEGRIYELSLKEEAFWHDGEKITADDVVFTVKTIQDPDYKSPEIANWVGIEVEKISDYRVIFRLRTPYFPFLERLTLKLLPEHIFGKIPAENFALIQYNLSPIGSGPFRFEDIEYNEMGKVETLALVRNESYHGQTAYLDQIYFHFFESSEELAKSLKKGELQGTAVPDLKNIDSFRGTGLNLYQASLPRYFAAFLNPEKNKILEEGEIRKALSLATNKKEILEQISQGNGWIVNSPLMPEIYGFEPPSEIPQFNLSEAEEIIQELGFEKIEGKLVEKRTEKTFEFSRRLESGSKGKEVEELQECLSFFSDIYPEGTVSGYFGQKTKEAVTLFQEKYQEEILAPWGFNQGTGIVSQTTRKKLNEVCNTVPQEIKPIKLSLLTINQPFLLETAEILKEQWGKLGFEIEIRSFDFNKLSRDFIKPREYEVLIFGEMLNTIPDPFPFWHSSRKKDPGLNLSLYENEEADKFLEKAREATSLQELKENLEEFQNVLIKDNPAIFLYSSDFVYSVSKKIKGIDLELLAEPSKRFSQIENWHLKIKRF